MAAAVAMAWYFPICRAAPMGRTLDEALRHAMGAAGEWRKLFYSRARDRLRHCATEGGSLLQTARCWRLSLFERGKPGRGEYLASQPAR